jgi:hypothetical protein
VAEAVEFSLMNVVLWLLVKLVFFTFKLAGIAIAVAVAAAVFFGVRKAIEGPR